MSLHAYSRVWLHITWGTLERRPLLPKPAAAKVSSYLYDYAEEKRVYMKINFVNPDHAHVLVDLPTSLPIDDQNRLIPGKFSWARGYGAFSVSHSGVEQVARYIARQEEHHRKRTFSEELELLVKKHGLVWRHEETVETVQSYRRPLQHPTKVGC
jgi:putative transposase